MYLWRLALSRGATAQTRAADIVQSYVDEQARAFVSALGNKDDN